MIGFDAMRDFGIFAIFLIVVFAIGPVSGCSTTPPPDYEFFDSCNPKEIPDNECYASKRAPASEQVALATEIAHQYISVHPAVEQAWNWEEAVLMYAMTELYRVTGDTQIRDYYKAWIDHHIEEGYAVLVSDGCPPALVATSLYEETGDESYADISREVLRYLDEDAQRTEQGGISHMGALNIVSLWVDSLFMFGMVLNRWGELSDDEKTINLMGEQLNIFATLLQSENGLFVHAYDWPLEFDTDIYWGRGNSWVTVATADYLRVRTLRHEEDKVAEEILSKQIKGILDSQDASGAWWSIMNHPEEIYLETSAAALFAYGLARAYRYGFAGDEVLKPIKDAVTYVQDQIDRDEQNKPIVTGISGPTMVGTFDNYARVSLLDDASFGIGGVILALIETSGLP